MSGNIIVCPCCKAVGEMSIHPRNPFMGTFSCIECGYRASGFMAGSRWTVIPLRTKEVFQ